MKEKVKGGGEEKTGEVKECEGRWRGGVKDERMKQQKRRAKIKTEGVKK